jgi:predicted permease
MNRRSLLVIDLDPVGSGYKEAEAIDLNMRLRGRMLAVPGIEAVSFSQNGLFSWRNYDTQFDADGFHDDLPRAHTGVYDHVGPRFLAALGTRVIAGRDFNERDDRSAPSVVIVNREFVHRVFEDRNPVGQNLYLAEDNTHKRAYRIVGVVENVRNEVRYAQPLFYLCQLQTRVQSFSTRFLVRTRQYPEAVVSGLRAAIHAEDASLEAGRIDTADALLDSTLDTDRLMATLAWGFGVLAMVLAAVGIYGLLSYDVTRRTGEIGIRMALGAYRSDIMRLVLREVAMLCFCGLTIGTVAALGLSRLVEGMVFGLKAGDPRVEAGAAVILIAVAVVAAWFPARRAARLDPMAALRSE